MSGQKPREPFHVNRDNVRDNLTVVRKLRLPRGAQARSQRTYGAVELTGSPLEGVVNMPYTGNFYLTVSGGPGEVTINNPFITGNTFPPIVLVNQPGTGASVVASAPGQAVLTTTADGLYVVRVGLQTDA